MKFLCVCQYGHSRSVCCARALQARGHEAAALGWGTALSAIPLLAQWADRIVVMEPSFARFVDTYKYKVSVFNVGPDRWSNPYNSELRKMIDDMIDKEGFPGVV